MATGRKSEGREAIWMSMRRRLGGFTLQELVMDTGEKLETVRDYVTGLVNAGFVVIRGKRESPSGHPGASKRTWYTLAKDIGVDAPRVRRNGTLLPETGRDRMWRAMRILKEFSILDLAVHATLAEAPVALREAQTYCLFLARAGCLSEVEPGRRYRFLQATWTGPRAPFIRRIRQVVDANTGELLWEGEPTEERP